MFSFIVVLALTGALLLLSFILLHKLLKGCLRTAELISLGLHSGSFLGILIDFESAIGFVCGNYSL
jgi:hypothetical protein